MPCSDAADFQVQAGTIKMRGPITQVGGLTSTEDFYSPVVIAGQEFIITLAGRIIVFFNSSEYQR